MPYNYLRYSIITLLFLTPLVALVVSPSLFFPYITGKNLLFRLLVEIAFVLYILLALRIPAYRPKLNTVFMAFGVFITVILAADLFGVYPFKSFWSNFERMEGFVTHLHLFAYFIMLSALFTGEKLWTRFFQVALSVGVLIGLIGLDPVKATSGRIFSTLGNSSYLGIYMLFNIFIAGFLLVRVIERRGDAAMKWLAGSAYGAIILFDFYILYNTGTRGALLGLVAGTLFVSVAFALFEKNKGLKVLGISVLAAIVITIGLLASFKESPTIANSPLLARFAALATFDRDEIANFATTQGRSRFGIWGIAYEGFKEKPLLGWGQDNFNYVFNEHYDPEIYDQEQWFDRAHNVFFDWLVAGGILGLLAYLALFITGVVAIWRSRANEKDHFFLFSDKVILTALLIAYFIHNLFVFDNITSYILFFGILAFIGTHDRKVIALPALAKPVSEKGIIVGSVASVVVGACALYWFTLAPYLSGITLIEALKNQQVGEVRESAEAYQAALDSFDKVLSRDSVTGIFESREQLLQGAQVALSLQALPNEIKSEYFTKVSEQFEAQLASTPADTRYYLFYGSFLARVGIATGSDEMLNQGMAYLLKAAELSPRKQSVLSEVGAAYLNSDKVQEALPFYRKAFELQESSPEARLMYGAALVYAGQNASSTAILAPLQGTAYAVDLRLVRAYHETKQPMKTDELLKAKIAYARTLVSEGRKEEAIRQINEVIRVSSPFKAQGEQMIAEIEKMQ